MKCNLKKFQDQSGISLIDALIATAILGIVVTVGGFISQNAFKAHEILKKRVDKYIVQNSILNSFDCVSTFQLIDPKICEKRTSVIARDSQGEPLEGQSGPGKVFEAVCSPKGIHFNIDISQEDFSNTDPDFNYNFCSYHLSNSSGSLSLHRFYRDAAASLNRTNTNCDSLLNSSYFSSLSPTLYKGRVSCPDRFYAVMGGANCSNGNGLVVAAVRSTDPGMSNTWEATCCSEDIGATAHSVHVSCIEGKD